MCSPWNVPVFSSVSFLYVSPMMRICQHLEGTQGPGPLGSTVEGYPAPRPRPDPAPYPPAPTASCPTCPFSPGTPGLAAALLSPHLLNSFCLYAQRLTGSLLIPTHPRAQQKQKHTQQNQTNPASWKMPLIRRLCEGRGDMFPPVPAPFGNTGCRRFLKGIIGCLSTDVSRFLVFTSQNGLVFPPHLFYHLC